MTSNPHPAALTIWTAALSKFRRDFPEARQALGHVVDLAREAFFRLGEGKEEDPRYATEGPTAARIQLLTWVAKWSR